MTTTFESAAEARAAYVRPKVTPEILEIVRKRIKRAIDGMKKRGCATDFDHYDEVKWEMNYPYTEEEFRIWLAVYTSAVEKVAAKELRPIGYSIWVDDNQHKVFISWDEE